MFILVVIPNSALLTAYCRGRMAVRLMSVTSNIPVLIKQNTSSIRTCDCKSLFLASTFYLAQVMCEANMHVLLQTSYLLCWMSDGPPLPRLHTVGDPLFPSGLFQIAHIPFPFLACLPAVAHEYLKVSFLVMYRKQITIFDACTVFTQSCMAAQRRQCLT